MITFFVLWAVAQAVLYVGGDLRVLLFFDQLAFMTGLGIAWAFLLFAKRFPYSSGSLNRFIVLVFTLLTLISFALMVFDVSPATKQIGTTYIAPFEHNSLFLIFVLITFVGIFLYAYSIFWQKYLSSSGDTRELIKYVFFSSLIPVIAGATLNILFVLLGFFNFFIYSPIFTLIFTFSVAYLLVRSRSSHQ